MAARAAAALALLPAVVVGHGAIITPRSRNSWDYTVGVNTPKDWPTNADCTNVSGTDPADSAETARRGFTTAKAAPSAAQSAIMSRAAVRSTCVASARRPR